ncbi:unnamed protein product [Polarella glacialis]|uniref:Uncharacterized protein n=1 Tax=Polarella glacialis TaxID=89957 RepID=A0A813FQL3_POLGL|nr:unnamed protein product [Polarella glacialis]
MSHTCKHNPLVVLVSRLGVSRLCEERAQNKSVLAMTAASFMGHFTGSLLLRACGLCLLMAKVQTATPLRDKWPGGPACMDAYDQGIWTTTGAYNFNSLCLQCGLQSILYPETTVDCVRENEDGRYTTACSTCIGSLISCTITNCQKMFLEGCDSPACKSCIAGSCDPAFTTCSGLQNPITMALSAVEEKSPVLAPSQATPNELSAPMAGLSVEACMDAHDQGIWTSTGSQSFSSLSTTCGRQCSGAAKCSAQCIQSASDGGYTPACSTCMGSLISCTVTTCDPKCWRSPDSCKSCIAGSCNPTFTTCSGLQNPVTNVQALLAEITPTLLP